MRNLVHRAAFPVLGVVLALTAAFAALPAAAAATKPVKAAIVKTAATAKSAVRAKPAATKAAQPVTWTVLVGGETKGATSGWEFLKYYPGTIQINVGDTIVFKLNSSMPHTVTFTKAGTVAPRLMIPESKGSKTEILNPLAVQPQGGSSYNGSVLTGSGQLGNGQPTEYKLTFTKTGEFTYYSAFDPTMIGHVIVRKAGTKYPETQAQINAAEQKALRADDAAVAKLQKGRNLDRVVTRAGATRGTLTHIILAGWGNGTYSWMRFGPANVSVKAGDRVEWVEGDTEMMHTVTFTSGGAAPEFVKQQNSQGTTVYVLNPQVLGREGSSAYDGTGYFNSGLLEGTRSRLAGPRIYTLRFTKPGTYSYLSDLPGQAGMKGTITVKAAQARTSTTVAKRTVRAATLKTHKAAPKPASKKA